MKKLLDAFLTLSVSELAILFKTDTIVDMQEQGTLHALPQFAEIGEALAPKHSTVSPTIKKAVSDTRALLKSIFSTMSNVPSSLTSDQLTPLAVALLPADYTTEQYYVIKTKINKLHEALDSLPIAGKMQYALVVLEMAVSAKLPFDETNVAAEDMQAAREEHEKTLQEHAAQAATPELKAIIETLKRKEVDDQAHVAAQEAEQARAKKIIARMRTVLVLEQEAIKLKNEINIQFAEYKQTLRWYMDKKLEKNPELFRAIHAPKKLSPDEENVQTKMIQTQGAEFAKQHLNYTRAAANYQLIEQAEKKLNSGESKNLVERLTTLYKEFPKIGKSLENVGDNAVDTQTNGLKGFFRKIWNRLKWVVSEAGKETRQFAKSSQTCRERFFNLKRKFEPNYEENKAKQQNLIQDLPSLRSM